MPGIEILLEQWTTTPLTADEKPQLSLQILEKAEDITGKRVTENVSRDEWLRFLDITGKSGFLIALDTRENRGSVGGSGFQDHAGYRIFAE